LLEQNKFERILGFWLLSNAEVPLQHCSATKTTKMLSSLFSSKYFMKK